MGNERDEPQQDEPRADGDLELALQRMDYRLIEVPPLGR